MGVANATQWLAKRLEPHSVDETEAVDMISDLAPNGNILFIVDWARFMHAAQQRMLHNREFSSFLELVHETAGDIAARAIVVPGAATIIAIDNYTEANSFKAMTEDARNNRIDTEFVMDHRSEPNPDMDEANFKGIYGSRKARLAFHQATQRTLQWGHTAFTDTPHCVSLDPTETQHMVQRIAHVHLTHPPQSTDMELHVDITSALTVFRTHAGPSLNCVPSSLLIRAFWQQELDTLWIQLEMGGIVKDAKFVGGLSEVQWIPFVFRLDKHTLVINISELGQFSEVKHERRDFTFAPTVCVDLFSQFSCPQLRSQPAEADFSSIEFAAAAARDGYECIVRVAGDCDWALLGLPLQRAISHKSTTATTVMHICPSNKAPDRWVNMRTAVEDRALDSALLWYIVGHHDFSNGIKGVGKKAQESALDDWLTRGRSALFPLDKNTPSKVNFDRDACLQLAIDACRHVAPKDTGLHEKLFTAKKVAVPVSVWLQHALHPIITTWAALWPLDEMLTVAH
jgi:hypothetical protein